MQVRGERREELQQIFPEDGRVLNGPVYVGRREGKGLRSKTVGLVAMILLALAAGVAAVAGEHPGREYLEKNGYKGPASCEAQGCHPGTAKEFLSTVHWKHASKVSTGADIGSATSSEGRDVRQPSK